MKISTKLIVFLLLGITAFSIESWAQPFQIKITLEGLKDTNIYLAHYYGSKVLLIDSARLDKTGTAIFQNKEKRSPGIYIAYLNKDKYFDFLLGADQQFTIRTSFDPLAKRVFEGATETEAFQQYQDFLSVQRNKQQKLQKDYEAHKSNPDSLKILTADIERLNNDMESYWEKKSLEYQGTFLADFLRSMIYPRPAPFIVPADCKNPDSLKWVMNYNFMVAHYWDNFNFAQPGMIRTPLIDGRLDGYFKNTLLQIPDSFLRPTITVIEKAKANEEMFRYISLQRLNDALSSEVMGMDKLFVEIAERYFLNGKAAWLDTAALAKVKEKVRVIKPNLIGNLAPELKLPDSEGMYYSLRQMNSKYTILLFWEPNCSHCKKTVPQLYKDLYLLFKDKGVDIYAVCTQNKKDDWMKAISEYKINDWTNVWDPSVTSNFRSLYDVYSTPVMYILDPTKHIIAKRLDVESAVKFLNHLMEKK
ncbi:MAG: redoxin domain-containing protein [Bacteroidia bacterium]|nr:redoxin domain-containing protein [Bacteroidia bacterium]